MRTIDQEIKNECASSTVTGRTNLRVRQLQEPICEFDIDRTTCDVFNTSENTLISKEIDQREYNIKQIFNIIESNNNNSQRQNQQQQWQKLLP